MYNFEFSYEEIELITDCLFWCQNYCGNLSEEDYDLITNIITKLQEGA